MVLDFALADAHPDLDTLTLKCQPGFFKSDEDGSISLMPKVARLYSVMFQDSIAFPFNSWSSLTLTSKTLANDYQNALLRFLLRKESCWLQLRVHNFNFEAVQLCLQSCSQQQLSQLRAPGKLVLQLSAHGRRGSYDFQTGWCANTQKWSSFCKEKKVSPWVIFTRARFVQCMDQQTLQNALAKASAKAMQGSAGEQVVMILDALDDICKQNSWLKTGYWLGIHERTHEELQQEECYFKGVEYGSDGKPIEELVGDRELLEGSPSLHVAC